MSRVVLRRLHDEAKLNIGRGIDQFTKEFPKIVDWRSKFDAGLYTGDLQFEAKLAGHIPAVRVEGLYNYLRFLKVSRGLLCGYLKRRRLVLVKMETVDEKCLQVQWRLTGESRLLFFGYWRPKHVYEGYSHLHFNSKGLVHRHTVDKIIPPPKIPQSVRALLWWWRFWRKEESIQLG